MKIQKSAALVPITAFFAASMLSNTATAAACSGGYTVGDVFASVGSSTVNVYTPTGSLVCTLNDAANATYTTGSGFDSSGNFLVTNFSSGTVSKFDNSGNLVSSAFMTSGNTPESVVNVSTGPFAGYTFVGGPSSTPIINEYNTATGALVNSISVAGGNGTGGTDWLDFLNPTTIIYDGEGTAIKSFNLATMTQLPDFATDPNYGYAMRVLTTGTFAGDVLRADSSQASLLDATGTIIKSYTLPGELGGDFSLNLDPNGTDFWTGDYNSGILWEVNIATGAIDNQINTGSSNLYGVSVYGEITSSGGGITNAVPEPSTYALMALGLTAVGAVARRRRAAN